MKNRHKFTSVILFLTIAILACGSATPTETTQQIQTSPTSQPSSGSPTATRTRFPVSSPTPTTVPLQLEVVQSQTWTDDLGNARANVLFRNPYDFPVSLGMNPRATLVNSAGKFMRDGLLYFLDGVSGGGGFILPGETIAANACFTCEEALLTEEWDSIKFVTRIEDITGQWNYVTNVEASGVSVSFDGDSPIFDVSGTVANNSDSALDRISVRIIVFDQDGNLVGAAEASAWDVGAGTTVSFSGYGIGQAPDGPVTYEVTALGVNY